MNDEASSTFEAALDAHGPRVLGICRRMLGDAAAGEDAAQDAFLRLWGALLRGRGPRATGPWLNRAAASAALDVLRRRGSLRETCWTDESDGGVAAAPPQPPSAAPDSRAEASEFADRLARAVAALPDSQRAVFVLRHDAALPLSEVAELLGVATTTAKTHFARATVRVRAALAEFAPEG